MGEYYDWVNITKKQYICPCDFDCGNKVYETTSVGNSFLAALYELLDTDWKGDEIVFLGDETEISDHEQNKTMRQLHDKRKEWGEPGYDSDYVYECYRNVSGLFKAAEKEIREEIGYILSDHREGREVTNQYGIDLDDPFKGLFIREGKQFRFIINETKREYYEIERLPIKSYTKNAETLTYQSDPLPILFAYGRTASENFTGSWIGDTIRPSNEEPPEGYRDVGTVYRW